jgi:hypothetical protein
VQRINCGTDDRCDRVVVFRIVDSPAYRFFWIGGAALKNAQNSSNLLGQTSPTKRSQRVCSGCCFPYARSPLTEGVNPPCVWSIEVIESRSATYPTNAMLDLAACAAARIEKSLY